ncbi:MAG TPA: hypothetical protein VIU61_21900 [Kofleriaceae bacterium]
MTEPPQPKRRSATLPAEVAAKLDANQTVELDTADFDELGQAGVIAARPNATAPTEIDVARIGPDGGQPNIVVSLDDGPNHDRTIAELPAQRLGEIAGQRDVQTQYVNRVTVENMLVPAPGRYRTIVIAIYLVVGAVLALSIYYRFG